MGSHDSNVTYKVGLLGATGVVGQRFAQMLESHPFFKLEVLGGSERSVGKMFEDVTNGRIPLTVPESLHRTIVSCTPKYFKDCDIVFSALDASIAGQIETDFANNGFPVFSNASNHRYDEDVPTLIPFVNPGHLELIKMQKSYEKCGGFIVTNPNCSTTGLCIAISPLHKKYGIAQMSLSTLQAVSGAGYPGLPALDVMDNVIPFIKDEEMKLEREPNKILGIFDGSKIQPAGFVTSAACHRVCVSEGHVVSVSLKLLNGPKASNEGYMDEICKTIKTDCIPSEVLNLPSSPEVVIKVFDDPTRPQPQLDRFAGNGMTVSVGRLRRCPLLDVKMTTLASNTIIGAAGCSILNAELAVAKGYVRKKMA